MLSFLGLILLIASIALFVSPMFTKTGPKISKSVKTGLAVVGIGLIVFGGALFYADPGKSYGVQYITGTQVAVLNPGYNLKLWGTVEEYNKIVTIAAQSKQQKEDDGNDEVTSGQILPQKVRFNDAVLARIPFSFRFQLSENPDEFLEMFRQTRSQEGLIQKSITPFVRKVLINSARGISASEVVAGKGSQFDADISDQLRNGTFELNVSDGSTSMKNINQFANDSTIATTNRGTEVKFNVTKKHDKDGNIIREKNPLSQYGIVLVQATVTEIDYEVKFDDMLALQRDASSRSSVAKQEAITAEFDKKRIIAVGEKAKAEITIDLEKKQIAAVIAAETAREAAKIAVETETLNLKKERLLAQQMDVSATAEANKKRKIYLADGALEKKLNALVQINKNYAEAIKEHTSIVPQIVMGGNNKSSSSSMDLINLLTATAATQVGTDIKTNTK